LDKKSNYWFLIKSDKTKLVSLSAKLEAVYSISQQHNYTYLNKGITYSFPHVFAPEKEHNIRTWCNSLASNYTQRFIALSYSSRNIYFEKYEE